MNKPLLKITVIVLLVAIGWMSGCKKADIVSEADVLGTWEIKSWVSEDPRFEGFDMLGAFNFSQISYNGRVGIRVTFTYTHNGIPETSTGYAYLKDLPKINFEVVGYYGRSIAFDGFIEDNRMIGRLGGSWAGVIFYDNDEWWEAVKK